MIEPRELRIGNYVELGGGSFKITPRSLFHLSEGRLKAEPIPLTEEILLKCGYVGINQVSVDGFVCTLIGTRLSLHRTNDYKYYILKIDDVVIKEVEALHELQNLVFDIARKELEIEL